jgi:predicted nucleic acid-binding protein
LAAYFLDTSALAKLYIREAGTDRMVALASRADEPQLIILSLSRVELRSAIRRRVRSRELTQRNAETALAHFGEHMGTVFLVQPLTEAVLERALTLIDNQGLRAYDAIQLAACLTLTVTAAEAFATFVCADHQLLDAARAEGLTVLNPSE